MRIVHVVRTMSDMHRCGVSAAVAHWALAQTRLGAEVEIFTMVDDEDFRRDDAVARYLSRRESTWWRQVSTMPRHSIEMVKRADVVHVHGIWVAPNWVPVHAAMFYRTPYVVTPHGMLDDWALRRSKWKKTLVRSLIEARVLARAGCLHALCRAEVDAIRTQRIDTPVALVPPGVDVDAFGSSACQNEDKGVALPPGPFVLFIGRIHPKKGLRVLVEAWNRVVAQHPGWHLVVAGPDEANLVLSLREAALQAHSPSTISFPGVVYGPAKARLLRGAAAFVLPSFSEGVPVAVLEALACGVPALITEACNLPEVEEARAGLVGEPTVDSLAGMLTRLMQMSESERREMGTRARRLAETRFERNRGAAELMAVYRWLVEGGEPPASLREASASRKMAS